MSTIEATEVQTVVVNTNAQTLKRVLSNAAVFASNDQARPVLCAVRIELEANELKVVSTDSYALYTETMLVDYDGEPATFLLSAEDTKRLVASIAKNLACILTFAGDTLTASDANGSVSTYRQESQAFPDYKAVIAHVGSGSLETVAFGSKLLAKVAKVKPDFNQTGSTGNAAVFHLGKTSIDATKVTIGEHVVIYLMPVRVA